VAQRLGYREAMKRGGQVSPPAGVEVPLGGGMVAVIDPLDVRKCAPYRWYPVKQYASNTYYAVTKRGGVCLSMHRLIVNAPDDRQVDHIDRDGLNNQRHNLRVATAIQNGANRAASSLNPTGLKGVRILESGRFAAQINRGGARKSLGTFDTPEEAALAYNYEAIRQDGEFARPNRLPATGEMLARLLQAEVPERDARIVAAIYEEGYAWHEVQQAQEVTKREVEIALERAAAKMARELKMPSLSREPDAVDRFGALVEEWWPD
jgi:hypothetical protein